MKTILYRSISGVVVVLSVYACKPDLKAPDVDKGSLDVTKYVAIGNSITAGYADAALYYDGQMVSYANLIAGQFKLIGGGEFRQPLMPVGSPGAAPSGTTVNSKLVLGYKTDCNGVTGLSPVPYASTGDAAALLTSVASQGPFNNMGVPGAKATHIVIPSYGLLNPFFGRMTADKTTATILNDAASQAPTFFSMFIGNNDVLGYATSGGSGDVITPSSGNAGIGFDASIDLIAGTMTAGGAKGAIANIPDVTSLPYFTTIPYNGLTLTRQGQVDSLNAAYSQLGITFSLGANPFIIQDANAPGFVRKIRSNEFVLLNTPQDSIKCAGWGSKKPLANLYVLTDVEINNVQTATTAYNQKLKSVADANGLAFVNVSDFMASVKRGIAYNGVNLSTTFVSGGAFSLDGVHLTPMGNAMLANEFLKAINSKYGSSIPLIDASTYKGVTFP